MNLAFSKALIAFKYLTILFSIIYWIFIVIDDWVFIVKYGTTNWLECLGIWMLYYLIFLLAFSFYFWVVAASFILIYSKLIMPVWKRYNTKKL